MHFRSTCFINLFPPSIGDGLYSLSWLIAIDLILLVVYIYLILFMMMELVTLSLQICIAHLVSVWPFGAGQLYAIIAEERKLVLVKNESKQVLISLEEARHCGSQGMIRTICIPMAKRPPTCYGNLEREREEHGEGGDHGQQGHQRGDDHVHIRHLQYNSTI